MGRDRSTPFGRLLQQQRGMAKLTQEELAERAGLSTRAVSDLERGVKTRPRPYTVQQLVKALRLEGEDRIHFEEVARGRRGQATDDGAHSEDDRTPYFQSEVPSWRSLLATPANELVGRAREIREVLDLLRMPPVRLLSLTGPGGTGKTRLALEAASRAATRFPAGVALIELAPLADPDHIGRAIAGATGYTPGGTSSIEEELVGHLHAKEILLVLDNFEHLMEGRKLVANLVRACPQLRVLVTSREALRLSAEHEYPVPPLALPPNTSALSPATLLESDAVALFVTRVRASRPHFALTQENAATVAAICRRLDGLPLAIELAAARIRLFSPTELLGRLNHRLGVLTGGARDLPQRQQTLRGAIDWSYQLLSSDERRLFARLSVFAGGWELQAAEGVCGGDGIDVLNGLESLIDKSLVHAIETADGETRFRMLETIREYASERLQGSVEGDEVHGRHAESILQLSREAGAGSAGPEQTIWLNRLDRELDNLREAMRWSLAHGRPEIVLEAINQTTRFWEVRGHIPEALEWLQRALEAEEVDPRIRGNALTTYGYLHIRTGDFARGGKELEEALALLDPLGHKAETAWVTNLLGYVALGIEDFDRAEHYFERSRQMFEEIGSGVRLAIAIANLGITALDRGDYQRARPILEDALERFRALHESGNIMLMLTCLGRIAIMQGDGEQAARLLLAAVDEARSAGYISQLAHAVELLPLLAALRGEPVWVARLAGALDSMVAETHLNLAGTPQHGDYEEMLQVNRARIGEEQWNAAWKEGRDLAMEDVGAMAERYLRPIAEGERSEA